MPKSKFKAIYKELKADIESERLPYQSLMPSENQLIVRFDCSRNTVRRAIAMLAEEGYVQPMHGRGVRVIYTKTQTPPFLIAGIESFGESARRNNLKTTTKLIRFTELTADDHISHRTGFAVGTELYYVQRVRSLDGDPCVFDVNLFDKKLAKLFSYKPFYYIAIGDEDFLYQANKSYRETLLDPHGYKYTYAESDCGHVWKNWRHYLTDFSQYLSTVTNS